MTTGLFKSVRIRKAPWAKAHGLQDMAQPCMAQRCMTQRCMTQRCMAQRCMAQRCMAQRCMAQRCVAPRCVAQQCRPWALAHGGFQDHPNVAAKTTVKRLLLFAIAATTALAGPSRMHALPQQTLSFEVATIKPTLSQGGIIGGSCHGLDSKYTTGQAAPPPLGRCLYSRVSLKSLVMLAYRAAADERLTVTGGENWAGSDEFDVEGKADDPSTATQAQLQVMLQSLLRERFKLQAHRETREEPGFALFVVDASKLKPASNEEAKPGVINQAPMGNFVILPEGTGRTMKGRSVNVASIARTLSGKPIADKTGLTGLYDVTVSWTPDVVAGGDGTDRLGPSWVTALREQLGLRVEAQKVPVPVLVIDHAEKPVMQ